MAEERVREGDWEPQGEKRKTESWVSAKRKRNKEGKPAWRREDDQFRERGGKRMRDRKAKQ